MKTRKKIIAILLMVICMFMVIGCGETTTANKKTTSAPTTVSPTTAAPTTAAPTTVAPTTVTPTTVVPTTVTTTVSTLNPDEAILPDLTGKSQAEIKEIMDELGFSKYKFAFTKKIYESEEEYDKFVKFGSSLEAGDIVSKTRGFTIYTTPLLLGGTEASESLTLLTNYEGKSYLRDGIGIVEVSQCVDGDTTFFKDVVTGETFSLRYLGIDTPESTALFEPWGKAASNYTKSRLENAEVIVLQADPTGLKDNNDRYLGWVWVDGTLLNLELVEVAYTQNKEVSGSLYSSFISDAGFAAQKTGRRVWGELDPNFDYSKEGIQLTLEELVTNFDTYIGKKLCVTGIISRICGKSPYIQTEDGKYGMYLYTGYQESSLLAVGQKITLDCVTATTHNGSKQLTDYLFNKVEIISENNPVEPKVIEYSDLKDSMLGVLVEYKNLTIVRYYSSSTNSATTYICETSDGKQVTLRIDSTCLSKFMNEDKEIAPHLQPGVKVNAIGPLAIYEGTYQIMLCLAEDVEIIE